MSINRSEYLGGEEEDDEIEYDEDQNEVVGSKYTE